MSKNEVSRRKWLQTAVGTVAGLAVGAAAGYYGGSASAPQAGQGTATTTVTGTAAPSEVALRWLTRDYNERYSRPYAADYQRYNPNANIAIETTAYTGLYEKLTTALMAGNAWDLCEAYAFRWLPAITAMDALLPLENYFNRDFSSSEIADYFPKGLAMSTVGGHLYSIPVRVDGYPLIYMADMFDEAGVDPKKPPDTWDELLEVAKLLTKKDASGKVTQYGLVFLGTPADNLTEVNLLECVYDYGGEVLSDDLKTSTLTKPETVEAWTFMTELHTKHNVVVPNMPEITWPDCVAMLAKKLGAMCWGIPMQYQMGIVKIAPNARVGISRPLAGPAGRFSTAGGHGFAIPKTTKSPEDTWRFVRWLNDPLRAAYLGQGIPGTKAALAAEKFDKYKADPLLAYALDGGLDYLKTNATIYRHPKGPAISTMLQKAFVETWNGADIMQTLQRTEQDINAIL